MLFKRRQVLTGIDHAYPVARADKVLLATEVVGSGTYLNQKPATVLRGTVSDVLVSSGDLGFISSRATRRVFQHETTFYVSTTHYLDNVCLFFMLCRVMNTRYD